MISRDVSQAETLWQNFDSQRSEKVLALDALYAELGYGGMIHHLKNLVLRQYDEDRISALTHLGGAKAALIRYASLNITEQERQALKDLERVLNQYTEAIDIVGEHVLLGRRASQIDPVVRVDDEPAFAALKQLNTQTREDGKCIGPCKARLNAELRRALGYGGAIHHFMNYVIRGDEQYRQQALEKINEASELLKRYQQHNLNRDEQQALSSLQIMLTAYHNNLDKVAEYIASGLTAEEIDARMIIFDTSAFQALNTLNRESIAESEHDALQVYQSLSTAQLFAYINLLSSLLLATIMIISAWWLIRQRIMNPIMLLTRAMGRLAKDELNTPIPATRERDEIGSMATALQVFKNNAHARQQTEAELRAVVDNTIDGIILIDTYGRIRSANPAACNIFGYSIEKLAGRNVKMLMPEQVAKHHDEYLLNYLDSGEKHVIDTTRELEGMRSNGEVFPLELGVTDVNTENARLFLGIVRDITERKRLERMKSEFVSTVSHELRTPLTSILGSLGLIRGGAAGKLKPKVMQMIDIAHNNAERLVRLINDILDTEKIESGRMQYHMQSLDLLALIKNSIEENRGYGERLGVELTWDEQHSVDLSIHGDRDRLMQVMANLLSNAIKYSPPAKKVEIEIEQQGDQAMIKVTDQGPGIPQEFRTRIFQKFSQADSSDTRQKGGTGLGLAITKTIVEHHGGSIGFNTATGEGTTFYVNLPLIGQAESALTHEQSIGRVLICEDDQDVASLLQMILREGKLDSDVALDATQAKSLLAKNDYLAMTLDLMLPGQDGISLLKELLEEATLYDLPVVVVSAKATEEQQDITGGAIHIIDWMDKPIDADRLLLNLHGLASSRSSEKPRILHVEDDVDVASIVRIVVGDEADVDVVATLAEARKKLKENDYQLVILDLILPDGHGEELLPFLQQEKHGSIPVLVFSADEIDSYAAESISEALVKTLTSNDQLLQSILSNIGSRKSGNEDE